MPFAARQERFTHKAARDEDPGALRLHLHRGFEKPRINTYVVQTGGYDERKKRKAFSALWTPTADEGREEKVPISNLSLLPISFPNSVLPTPHLTFSATP